MATQTYPALTCTRFYETHVDPQWSPRSESSPRQGALEADRLVEFVPIHPGSIREKRLWHLDVRFDYGKVVSFSG